MAAIGQPWALSCRAVAMRISSEIRNRGALNQQSVSLPLVTKQPGPWSSGGGCPERDHNVREYPKFAVEGTSGGVLPTSGYSDRDCLLRLQTIPVCSFELKPSFS